MDKRDGRIVRIAHTEDDFVFGVILQAVGTEALVHLGVSTLQRFKNRNRRVKGRNVGWERTVAKIFQAAVNREAIVANSGGGADSECLGNSQGKMGHLGVTLQQA